MNSRRDCGETVRLVDRRRIVGLAGAAVSSCFVNCSRRDDPFPRSTIRISAAAQLSMSGLYLAHESGYFRQAGLDVDIREIRDATGTLPLLAGGKLDVSFTAIGPPLINAVAKGARLKIVAGREIASPRCGDYGAVYGTRKVFPQGIHDIRLLKGKRIAIRKIAGITEFALELELASVGLQMSDVELISLRPNEAIAVLLGGHIDAIVSQNYFDRGVTVSSQLVRSSGLAQILPGFQYSYVLFGEKLLNSDPALGGRFLAAYLRGARDFLQGRTPRFMEEYARSNGLDPKLIREACRDTFTPDGTIDLGSLQRYIDWAVKKGYCPKGLAAAEAVDTRFLKLAHKELRIGRDQ